MRNSICIIVVIGKDCCHLTVRIDSDTTAADLLTGLGLPTSLYLNKRSGQPFWGSESLWPAVVAGEQLRVWPAVGCRQLQNRVCRCREMIVTRSSPPGQESRNDRGSE